MTRNQIILIGVGVLIVVALVVLLLIGARRPGKELSGDLTVWGVFDPAFAFDKVISSYRELHPKVNIAYRELDPNTYEQDLINALAAGRGPDIFMFHNSWLPKHFDKVWPLTDDELTLSRFRQLFPTVVEQDFAPDGVIYALPLHIDTLAMYYNKDIFDTKGIALPPKTWLELQNLIPRLRELDRAGRIAKAAVAIGGSNRSVNRASDILNLLMLQSGVKLVADDFSLTTFYPDGVESLEFYTQFANPASPYYTWNEAFGYSIDSFAEEKTAVMFNYAYQMDAVKEKNQFLNFAVAPMPQPSSAEKAVNWANYWGLTVSAKTQQVRVAWDFILYLTTNASASETYLSSANRPPALRSLIAQYQTHPTLNVFAQQTLTARSWPQIDNVAVENSFSKAIESVITGRATADRALSQAAQELDDLMKRRIR